MIACISRVRHLGAISFMTSTISLKNRSVMGQRLNHCAFLRLVRPSGWDSCPVFDSSGSPTVNGSPIPGRFAKCSGTGLHGNPIDVSPGGGNLILEAGPKVCFSSRVCLPRFCLILPPSLDGGPGLSMNDLAIEPSSSFQGLKCY